MPRKSIAAPLNPSAHRGRRLPAADRNAEPEPGAPGTSQVAVAPRPTRLLPGHRYRPGERLRMLGGGNVLARAPSFCKVVAVLPDEGRGVLLYRVRSDSEQFERVVPETDLTR